MGNTAPLYRQRRARESPLWALLDEHGETVRLVWSERFEEKYGPHETDRGALRGSREP